MDLLTYLLTKVILSITFACNNDINRGAVHVEEEDTFFTKAKATTKQAV